MTLTGPPIASKKVGVGPALVRAGADVGAPLTYQGSGGNQRVAFTYAQTTPVSVVDVDHGLGFRPNVALFNADYSIEYSEFAVQHMSETRLRVSMDRPTACVVVMS